MLENQILSDIINFFSQIFEKKQRNGGKYCYACYKANWLNQIDLNERYAKEEAAVARTTKKLQHFLKEKYGDRIKIEAPVAEGMTLRFDSLSVPNIKIDPTKLQAFDILDVESGVAFEISLSDAFAEFFKDVLKALLDSRVKKLYICMRNHDYKGARKSGYLKVKDSPMVQQYISLAKLYKLDIYLVDIFPECNDEV